KTSGFSFWDTERPPFWSTKMFCQQDDLTDVLGVVRHLPADRLENRVFLASYRDPLFEVGRGERLNCREDQTPSLIPPLQDLLWRGGGIENELAVAIAVWFLAVAG